MDCPKKVAHESPRNPFAKLSEDCFAEILSRTSPLDASRFAVVSKVSKSAADSDKVWERFLPMEIVSRSVSPLVYESKKELYFRLCNSHVLLDDGKLAVCGLQFAVSMSKSNAPRGIIECYVYPDCNHVEQSFSLTRETGKNCVMVGAKDLVISWGDNSEYWDWKSHTNSRFSEVAQLKLVYWLDIRGKITTHMLSSNTRYGAYLIFKLANGHYGFDHANVVVRRLNSEADKNAEARALIVSLCGRMAMCRDDGWNEIKLGDFYNSNWDEGVVEARLMEIRHLNGKSGLIVEGIEFRPSAPKAT